MSVMFTIKSWHVLLPLAIVMFAVIMTRTFVAKRYSIRQSALLTAFAAYAIGTLHFVFFPVEVNIGEYANLTPWYSTIQWIPLLTMDAKTFLLNMVLFVPFGLALPLLRGSNGSIGQVAYAAFWVSLVFELSQLAIRVAVGSGRMTDINDLIANSLGGALGYVIYRRLVAVKPFDRLLRGFRLQSR
ncbi:VanZ family protein [Paenibacillus aurantiacus]|uniref:VanZ family protein n=1 Tax=Paenibacillus aurantiacus TaxID=1936118 RepID=A0ABV5KVB5_9BACL